MKGDNAKSEDKSNNNTGTVDTHVGEIVSGQDKTSASSNRSSIGAHICDVTKTVVTSTQSVQDILAAHHVEDPVWDRTNSLSSDTVFWIPIRLTMWIHGIKLYNHPRNHGV